MRKTRHNKAPLLRSYVPPNDTVVKYPVFVVQDIRKNISSDKFIEHDHFKSTAQHKIKDKFIAAEIAN